jgi:hypothetical protein
MVACVGTRTFALGVILGSLAIGCSVQAESAGSVGAGGFGGSSSGSGSSSGGGSVQPMLVVVDPNRTMSATPGDGVGVFTQYETGGHWDIWWTCDTSKTSLPCAFDITVSVTIGAIHNVATQGLVSDNGDALTTISLQEIEAATTTTTTLQGITFDTIGVPDGTVPIITLNATLSGQEDGSYLFFVQDNAINGNYQGTLTDPLMLEPQSP